MEAFLDAQRQAREASTPPAESSIPSTSAGAGPIPDARTDADAETQKVREDAEGGLGANE
jgi:hypothetical protein